MTQPVVCMQFLSLSSMRTRSPLIPHPFSPHSSIAHPSLIPPLPPYLPACLQTKFTGGQVSPDAAAKLVALGAQLASYDFAGANRTQMELAQVDWGRTKEWHKGVRYLTTLALVKSGATAR